MDFRLLGGLGDDIFLAVPETDRTTEARFAPGDVPLQQAMATQDDFQLLRILGTLKLIGPDEQTYFQFQPPARLQVRFTADDLNRAGRRGKPLALGYWVEDHWERFPPGNVPANEKESGDSWAYFLIHAITDPPIAWGT